MAFNGSLLQLSGAEFPWQYIVEESYSGALKTLDLDSGRVATGIMERNVLDHQALEVKFNTRSLNNEENSDLWRFIRSHYTASTKERRVRVTAYVPEIDDYITQDCYVASDPTFPIRRIDRKKKEIKYSGYEIKFIGY